MTPMGRLNRLQTVSGRRAGTVTWLVFAALASLSAAGIAKSATDHLAPYSGDAAPNSNSAHANAVFASTFGADPSADILVMAPMAQVQRVGRVLRTSAMVGEFRTMRLVAPEPAVLFRALLRPSSAKTQQNAAVQINHDLRGRGISVGGSVLGFAQASEISTQDLQRAEQVALPALVLLLLLLYGSAIAALVPITLAVLSLIWTLAGLRLLSLVTTISVFSLNLVAALGVGLSIDFSLLMISRFREELARGCTVSDAAAETVSTAGRTVVFSCLTIIAALAALTVFPANLPRSLGIGGMMVTAVAGTLAVGLLPHILRLLGVRINAARPPWRRHSRVAPLGSARSEAWHVWARWVVRHRLLSLAGALIVLAVLAEPVAHLRISSAATTANLPSSASARSANTRIERAVGASTAPILIVADSRGPAGVAQRVAATVHGSRGVAAVSFRERNGYGFGEVATRFAPFSSESESLVRRLRQDGALVGGATAAFLDYRGEIGGKLPLAIAIAIVTTLILVFLLSRSVVLAAKVLLTNALTLGAVLGVMVWALEDGHFSGLLGYKVPGTLIDPTIPLFVAALAFGLATDYGIFLLSRAVEERNRGLNDQDVVVEALVRTGPLITRLALMFCVAVGAVMTSQIGTIKEAGLGMVVAVIIDATLVRTVLVPAAMGLLGRWNWWAPRFMLGQTALTVSESGKAQRTLPRGGPRPHHGSAAAGHGGGAREAPEE
jgi:uncharacterized membrane protein YdfJ with MMPL/SSD domain